MDDICKLDKHIYIQNFPYKPEAPFCTCTFLIQNS